MRPLKNQFNKIHRNGNYYYLVLLIIFMLQPGTSMANYILQHKRADTIPLPVYRVAGIVSPKNGEDFYTITFYESARFYQLYRKNKNLTKILKILKEAKSQQKPVQVWVTMKLGSVIDNVQYYKNK